MYGIEEDFDLDYVPTAMGNSRSGSMKKLTKKQPKTVPKQPPNKSKTKEQFEDLLDELPVQQIKKVTKPADKKPTLPVSKNSFDEIETYNDEPKSTNLDKTKQASVKDTAPTNSFLKTSMFKNDGTEEIINEDSGFYNRFGKTEQNIKNTSKVEEPPFVSNRNMKPPLKKKDPSSSNGAWSMGNVVLTIPQEQKSIMSSSKKQDDEEIIRPPPRLMNKRSIENKMDKKDDQPVLSLNATKSESPLPKDFMFDSKKEKKDESNLFQGYNRTASLTLDQPKDQKKYVAQSVYQPEKKINKVLQKVEAKIQQPKSTILNLNVQQSYTIHKDLPSYQINQNQAISADWEKQIQQMKANFQKQVDFLQENLDKQIMINRQTREKIIQDSSKMIEEQRERTNKMHQEQIKRLKDMFEWEKTRMEQTYKGEIHSLRQSLELANKTNGYSYKTHSNSKEDTSYLQMQLKAQKRVMEDRQKILQQREREFQQRQMGMNKQRRQQQQRLRSQQKRIMEQETRCKKQMIIDKKMLADEKQQAAIQVATLELQAIKKREKAEINLKQNSIDHESIENERNELRIINAELMRKYKVKIQDLESQKQRVRNMQQQLIKRLRVVQVKNRQMSTLSNINNKVHSKKQNNWLDDDKSHTRMMSTQKQNQHDKSMANITRTKDRFHQLEGNNRLNVTVQDHKKFNLDSYMMTMQQYNKLKADL